jgi:hypothetical protein
MQRAVDERARDADGAIDDSVTDSGQTSWTWMTTGTRSSFASTAAAMNAVAGVR